MTTAILLNYQRQPNMRQIIPALRQQTEDLHIAMINNGQPYTTESPDQEPDDLWIMPFNIGPFARFLAAYIYEGWLYFQDDDVIPKDDRYVADLLALGRERPDAITGVYGRHIPDKSPYYIRNDTSGPTNMIKTICMVMHRHTLGRMRMPPGTVGRCDDIWVSLETSQGEPIHFSDFGFARRLKQMPHWDTGLEHEPQHYPEREVFSAWWWRRGCRDAASTD